MVAAGPGPSHSCVGRPQGARRIHLFPRKNYLLIEFSHRVKSESWNSPGDSFGDSSVKRIEAAVLMGIGVPLVWCCVGGNIDDLGFPLGPAALHFHSQRVAVEKDEEKTVPYFPTVVVKESRLLPFIAVEPWTIALASWECDSVYPGMFFKYSTRFTTASWSNIDDDLGSVDSVFARLVGSGADESFIFCKSS